jgi:hypothetical protein
MPFNQPARVNDIISQLESLANIKPKTEAEAIGLAQARQELMNRMKRASEGSLRMPGEELEGPGFEGNIAGEVVRAPWSGEYDMPGNFERRQRMANSLAEDAALNAGRSHSYGWEQGQPVVADWRKTGEAMAANSPGFARDQTEQIYYSGPPDTGRMMQNLYDPLKWDPSGKRPFTSGDVESMSGLINRSDRVGGNMREAMARLFKDRPFADQIFGG